MYISGDISGLKPLKKTSEKFVQNQTAVELWNNRAWKLQCNGWFSTYTFYLKKTFARDCNEIDHCTGNVFQKKIVCHLIKSGVELHDTTKLSKFATMSSNNLLTLSLYFLYSSEQITLSFP